jgi:hypothetical protein
MTEDFSVRPTKPLTPEQRKERDAARRADAEQQATNGKSAAGSR